MTGGMLLDGYQTPPLHHATVLIEGGKIVQVGPASEVKIPRASKSRWIDAVSNPDAE